MFIHTSLTEIIVLCYAGNGRVMKGIPYDDHATVHITLHYVMHTHNRNDDHTNSYVKPSLYYLMVNKG